MRRPLLVALVAVALVAGLVVAGFLQAPTKRLHTPQSKVTDREVTGNDREAVEPSVRELLQRRAHALSEGDLDAWVADLDPADPAFVARQVELFHDLRDVGMRTWTYELLDAPYGLPDLAERYRAPAFIRVVLQRYAIEGFDVSPVARPKSMTFVERDGRWWLASDSDLIDRVEAGLVLDPWDVADVAIGRTDSAMLVVDQDREGELPQLLASIDRAAQRVSRHVGPNWAGRPVVYAVRNGRIIESAYEPGLPPDGLAAVATPLYGSEPGESAGVPSEVATVRLAVLPAALDAITDVRLMAHEIAHFAVGPAAAPPWLTEGLAEYIGQDGRRPPPSRLARLRRSLGAEPFRLPHDGTFYGAAGYDNYTTSWAVCRYLVETYGNDLLLRLYGEWDSRAGRRTDPAVRQQRVLRGVLGVRTRDVERGFAAWLTRVT